MTARLIFWFAIVFGLSSPVHSGLNRFTLNKIYETHAKNYSVPVKIVKAIVKVESNGKQDALVIWDNGSPSYGLMQIKLKTARLLGFKGTVKELRKPYHNVKYGVKYLKYQYDRYNNWDKAIVAYNAGSFKKRTSYLVKVKLNIR